MVSLVIRTDAPTISGPPQGQWTYADWETLGVDGNRYEIIDGVLYMTTAPSSFHQWISQQLYRLLGIPTQLDGRAYSFLAPIGVLMPGCDPVQPDFVLVLKEHADIIRDRRIRGVPDLIVEVVSPGSIAFDERVKLTAYALAGVPEYGVIDPALRQVRVFKHEAPGRFQYPREFGEGDTFSFDCVPDIIINVSELFAGAPDTSL